MFYSIIRHSSLHAKDKDRIESRCDSYRNPSLSAKMLSTLDIISNGRMELGIGAGWYEREYTTYGYAFPSHIFRIKQLDESLSIIKAMWKEKRASFGGKYY